MPSNTNNLKCLATRIHLNKEEFQLPNSIPWQKDEDVELTIRLRNLGMARKVMKQILSDQRKIEKQIKLENSTCKECKVKHPYHDSNCSEVAYHPCR